MAGINIRERDGIVTAHPAIGTDPDEVPVVFIVVKDGGTALAHPDYIAGELYEVAVGDRTLADIWDFLMVKTPKMRHPEICRMRMITGGEPGAAEVLIDRRIVHRFP